MFKRSTISHKQKTTKGFTLIELMVAMGIVVVMSVIGIAMFTQVRINSRDAKRKQDLRQISVAAELFKQTTGKYPCASTGWQTSAGTWLIDNCSGSTTNLVPNYINIIPTDPKQNTSTPWSSNGYGYYSASTDLGTCKAGQYFVLVTQLENTRDTDRNASKQYTACGIAYPMVVNGNTFSDNSFVVVNP